MKSRRRRRTLSLLAAVLVAASIGWVLDATNALRDVELATVDARFDVRGQQAPPPDVVLVAIDDRTIQAADGGQYPINRKRDAAVIGRLAEAGAGVIAYDVQFTDASEDAEADDAIVQAVADAPRVVLGTTEVGAKGTTGIFGGEEGLEYSGATPANSNWRADSDARVRRVHGKLQNLTTLPIAAAQMQLKHTIAMPAGGSAWIDFPGPTGSVRTLSFLDVEQGRFDADAVRGKVVVVGPTAPRWTDVRRTATSDRMPPAEVHAAAVATALAGFPLHEARWWVNALLVLALAALGPLAALWLGNKGAIAATVLGTGAFLLAAKFAFDGGTILAVVPALAAALAGVIGAVAVSNPERSPLSALLDRLTRGVGGNQRTRRLRAALLLGAMALCVISGLVLQGTSAMRRLELGTVDTRFDVRGTQPAPSDVVLVGIDDKTFREPPRPQFPFDRGDYAKVVRHLSEAGAKAIAVDVQITERDEDGEKGDEQLVEASRAAGNVVMATTEVGEHGEANVFFDIDTLSYSRATPGISNYLPDADQRIRRAYFRIQNRTGFAMAAARIARGAVIATPPGDTAWVDFAGPPGAIRRISFVDVRRGTFNPADVRGKVVVVGATAPVLQDFHSTATTEEGLMPGPEVHANAIHTVLAGFPLRGAPDWLNWLLVIALGTITPLVALRRGIVVPVVAGLLAVGTFIVAAQLAFNNGTIVSVVYPLYAGLAAILLSAAIHGLTVAFEREQARDAFARFVPEAVVDQVLADADGVRLGGVRGEATVMFSDLRGFTSFSETLEPERVIESLNRYLTEMSEAILDHGGTLVAYMGDGIMAVFGAPLKQDDHADRALEAAREMLDRMEGFNGWLRDQGLHDGFKMGIGLNSGPVMSGNVGSERRLEYTALGDTTNTAARLEGMTKGTPHQLYIADTTKQKLTRPADDLVAVGEAEVRGRKAKVLLWSITDQPAPAPADPAPAEPVEAPN